MLNIRTRMRIPGKRLYNKVFLLLALIVVTNVSCDGVDMFTFAKEMSAYGVKWSYEYDEALGTGTMTARFPESVTNAEMAANYSVNYSGTTGTVTLSSAAYDSATLTATLTLTFSSTDGSMFWIKIISSATPITMGTSTLDKITSPSYSTPGGSVSVSGWSPTSGSTISSGSSTIQITYTENVTGTDTLPSFTMSGSATGSITGISYDPGTYTTTLTVNATGIAPDTVIITVVSANITDSSSNVLGTAAATFYLP
ncbi:MAG TPA: hypothetical protein PKM26_10075 [Syntrophorhabdaceae bacterium]|nr:hypothetical protein [Syntrophorhabdaceae bacterium]